MFQIEIKTDEVMKHLRKVAWRGKNLTMVMRDFGERMLRSKEKTFAAGGRPKKWPISKRAREEGGKTLIDSAILKNSITYKPGKDYLKLGTNKIYGLIHQLGGKAGRGRKVKMPARPFLVFQKEDLSYVGKKIIRFVTEGRL